MTRKVVSLLSLLLLLSLVSSPALAAGPRAEKEPGLVAFLWTLFDAVLEMGRSTIDPNGSVAPDLNSETDGRWIIDPNG